MTSTKKLLTLVLIVDKKNSKVLLGMKKRGFGKGWWNGFGGKVHEGETIRKCAQRETLEECGLEIEEFNQIGHMVFEFVGDPVLLDVTVFRCEIYSGDFRESEEMRPEWFNFDDVPFDQMWPDDYMWYPHMFNNQKFSAKFLFEGHHKMLQTHIELVDNFNS